MTNKLNRKRLKDLILEELDRLGLLLEQEEDDAEGGTDLFADDAEGGDDEGGDDEGGDEEGGDTGGGGGGDTGEGEEGEEGEGEEGGDEEEEEEEEKPEILPGDEIRLGKSIDDEIQSLFLDYEASAIKSAEMAKNENRKYSLKSVLLEATDEDIDLERFSSDIVRLIMNYDNLLDMESLFITKAKSFLIDKYDEETSKAFEEILDVRHGISIEVKEEDPVPLAIGAGAAPE